MSGSKDVHHDGEILLGILAERRIVEVIAFFDKPSNSTISEQGSSLSFRTRLCGFIRQTTSRS
jgi:hypothetical protein